MPPPIDAAILRALSLDPSTAQIASHGGSGFASTFRITTTTSGTSNSSRSFFVKTSPGPAAAVMFEGEHASLNAIHSAVPSLCPHSLAWGKLEDHQGSSGGSYFLATEFLDLFSSRKSSKPSKSGSGLTLAQKLAKLHTTPAPIPSGHDSPQFGFPVTTCCGDTPQPNNFTPSWPSFFAQNRLLSILQRGESRNGADVELRHLVDQTAYTVVPRLLDNGHLGGAAGIKPVVVHGDLWSGNHGRGNFVGRGPTRRLSDDEDDVAEEAREEEEEEGEEEVIFDPSCSYAHSEYELGIMRMFGGFGVSFMHEYHRLVPKTEPVDEYDDRVRLYEVYHHLNHWAIFGGGYRGGAVAILKQLVRRYGGEG